MIRLSRRTLVQTRPFWLKVIDGSTSFESDASRCFSNSGHLQVTRSKQEMTATVSDRWNHINIVKKLMWGWFCIWFYALISKIHRESIITRFSNQLTRIGFQELGCFGSKCLWPCVDLKICQFSRFQNQCETPFKASPGHVGSCWVPPWCWAWYV